MSSQLSGHWIEVQLAQPAPNVNAIGAWLEVKRDGKVMRREITSGGGHASGQSGWVHMGLGAMEKAELRVVWPDGTAGEWETLRGTGFTCWSAGRRQGFGRRNRRFPSPRSHGEKVPEGRMRGSAGGSGVSLPDIALPAKLLINQPFPHFPPSELPLIRPWGHLLPVRTGRRDGRAPRLK